MIVLWTDQNKTEFDSSGALAFYTRSVAESKTTQKRTIWTSQKPMQRC